MVDIATPNNTKLRQRNRAFHGIHPTIKEIKARAANPEAMNVQQGLRNLGLQM